MTATDVLFRPFRIGAMELANRFVTAPMISSFAADEMPAATHATCYRRRAHGVYLPWWKPALTCCTARSADSGSPNSRISMANTA